MIFDKKVFLILALLFLITQASLGADNQTTDNQEESNQQISGFSLAGYGEKGKKTWDITSKSADIFDNEVKLNDIIGKLYGESEEIKLTADKGNFDKKEGKMHLQDNVVITTTSGARLTTASLDWDRKKETVTTTDLVNIRKDNMLTTSKGAIGHPSLSQVTLEKDVTVELTLNSMDKKDDKPQSQGKIVITCDGPVEIDYQKNVATFKNKVKVDKQDFILYSDIMDIFFLTGASQAPSKEEAVAPKQEESVVKKETAPVTTEKKEADSGFNLTGSKIDKIVAQGNVKIVRGENVSYCEKAIYTGADSRIMLSGRPKLIIYSAEDFGNASFGN